MLSLACSDDSLPDDAAALPTETLIPPTEEPASGACALLRLSDIEELIGSPAQQLSSTGQSCGYSHDGTTVVLTLQPAHAFETNRDAFAQNDDPQDIPGLGVPAVYFDETLNGALLVQSGETLILSGAGDLELSRQLAERILSRQ